MQPGTIGWIDLTVSEAVQVRDFYEQVVGWGTEARDMGGYSDFVMTADGTGVAGICHSRGVNSGIPQQWLIYIVVDDLAASLERCRGLGGEILFGPRNAGSSGKYAVIQDPAGAVAALYESQE